ncbi:hypothetical protein GQ55_9G389900 [Panicum hallii var. hallii]|uniref:Uncharacterized protein n=1 Tax=Panicum hallii var. hallii TaxID=1504633 RepID=A0A2T7C9K6_9POAL|nr:hypothetical protein GQ55_9G389900 [Panicum hallii var. hallii]PUZ40015.1 hypothetical protein GQ55_9G389900 [Panicum hallii var. hallii]PUZ40016.1 hypothetical protein GQ55_9G389900 [Panicum hallii var. hallii]PUZ40017.1 hypothetical protein GQ55_9G389900 [Panicum hallii var. hallii]PUZ40018.1 hypothetical protein GQ55_9G389900 [Panicum hallii var. hallii]
MEEADADAVEEDLARVGGGAKRRWRDLRGGCARGRQRAPWRAPGRRTGRGRGSRRRWGTGASGALQQAAPPPQRPPQRIDAQPRRGTTISRRPTASDAAGTAPDCGTRSMASAPTPCHSPSRSLAATQPGRTFPTRGEDRGSTSLSHGRRTPK